MSSLNNKLSKLADEYQHSKNSPAYRELKLKYKALKSANKELVQLLTQALSDLRTTTIELHQHENMKQKKSRKLRNNKKLEETECFTEDESIAYELVIKVEDPSSRCMDNIGFTDFVNGGLNENGQNPVVDCDRALSNENELNFCEQSSPELVRTLTASHPEFFTTSDDEGSVDDMDVIVEHPDVDIQAQIKEEIEAEYLATSGNDQTSEVVVEETEEVEIVEEEEVEYEEVEETEEVEYEEVEEETEEVEVVEEEVDETEEVEVVEEEEEVVEYEEVEEEEDEESGVYEIEVNGVRYYTTNEKDGIVYSIVDEDDVGDEIGKFVNGKLVLNK
jgi:hypothetical protein